MFDQILNIPLQFSPLFQFLLSEKYDNIATVNLLSANPTKWSITIKQFVGNLSAEACNFIKKDILTLINTSGACFWNLS